MDLSRIRAVVVGHPGSKQQLKNLPANLPRESRTRVASVVSGCFASHQASSAFVDMISCFIVITSIYIIPHLLVSKPSTSIPLPNRLSPASPASVSHQRFASIAVNRERSILRESSVTLGFYLNIIFKNVSILSASLRNSDSFKVHKPLENTSSTYDRYRSHNPKTYLQSVSRQDSRIAMVDHRADELLTSSQVPPIGISSSR